MINEWAPFICTVKSVYIGFTDSGEGERGEGGRERERCKEIAIGKIEESEKRERKTERCKEIVIEKNKGE